MEADLPSDLGHLDPTNHEITHPRILNRSQVTGKVLVESFSFNSLDASLGHIAGSTTGPLVDERDRIQTKAMGQGKPIWGQCFYCELNVPNNCIGMVMLLTRAYRFSRFQFQPTSIFYHRSLHWSPAFLGGLMDRINCKIDVWICISF